MQCDKRVVPSSCHHRPPSSGLGYRTVLTRVAACVWRSILGVYVTSPKTKVAPSDRHQKPIDLERGSGSISVKSIPVGSPIQL
jgi:hypothetical protein